MLSFRDAGIKKQEPLCVAIINSRSIEKKEKAIYLISVSICSVLPLPLEGLGPILS